MPYADIGRWELFVPDGWEPKDQGIGVSYFESSDGTKGMYAKTLKPQHAEPSARHLAEYVQRAHRSGFEADGNADWHTMAEAHHIEGDLVRSTLDLWDESAGYRVLSYVVCSAREAVQVTFHDYLCDDYKSTEDVFVRYTDCIQLAAGAA